MSNFYLSHYQLKKDLVNGVDQVVIPYDKIKAGAIFQGAVLNTWLHKTNKFDKNGEICISITKDWIDEYGDSYLTEAKL